MRKWIVAIGAGGMAGTCKRYIGAPANVGGLGLSDLRATVAMAGPGRVISLVYDDVFDGMAMVPTYLYRAADDPLNGVAIVTTTHTGRRMVAT